MSCQRNAFWLILVLAAADLTGCGGAATPDTETAAGKIPVTTSSEEARSAYLQGRQLLDDLRITDAHQFFVESVEADPDFALGHLGVANTSSTAQAFFDALRRAVETSATASDGERMQITAFEAGSSAPSSNRSSRPSRTTNVPATHSQSSFSVSRSTRPRSTSIAPRSASTRISHHPTISWVTP